MSTHCEDGSVLHLLESIITLGKVKVRIQVRMGIRDRLAGSIKA
jgi:hypothetical protein